MNLRKFSRIAAIVCVIALLCLTMTGCATAGTDAGDAAATTSSYSMLIMMVVLVVVFYFFMIRPENKKKKALQQMRDSLSVGDSVTTIGGIMGKIVSIKDDTITFETSEDRVRVQVAKWAISTTGKNNTEEPK